MAGVSSLIVGYTMSEKENVRESVVDTLLEIGSEGVFTYVFSKEPLVSIMIILAICLLIYAFYLKVKQPQTKENSSNEE